MITQSDKSPLPGTDRRGARNPRASQPKLWAPPEDRDEEDDGAKIESICLSLVQKCSPGDGRANERCSLPLVDE